MYSLVRIIIGVLLLIGMLIYVKKSKKIVKENKKRLYFISVIITVFLVNLLSLLPFEYWFVTFDSPEKAFKYYHGGKYKETFVVPGEYSDLVVGYKGTESTFLIVPKTENGWKINTGTNTKESHSLFTKGIPANIYQYKDTSDYYVIVHDMDKSSEVVDSCNSKFVTMVREIKGFDDEIVTRYANVPIKGETYWISVDGIKVTISEETRGAVWMLGDVAFKILKVIGIGLALLPLVCIFIALYIHNASGKDVEKFYSNNWKGLENKIKFHRGLSKLFFWQLFNKNMRLIHGSLSLILASMALVADNEAVFLKELEAIKKEKEVEMKPFLLALYYRSKGDEVLAKACYDRYLQCKQDSKEIRVVMEYLFYEGNKYEREDLESAIKNFENPAIIQLLKENEIYEA